MEFTFSQIKEYTVGALSVTQDEGGYRFNRFTPTQRAAFGAVVSEWADRADHTTGICIDFHTDAMKFFAEVSAAGKYEVYVDDLCTYFSYLEAGATIELGLDGGDHRITLILPCRTCGRIKAVRLEGESYVKPHTYRGKIAFYGDSITQGIKAEKDSQCYAWLLTRYFDFYGMNFGVGGIRFQPETVEDIGFEADVVIVALGTNNYGSGKPMELLQTNCAGYFDRIAQIYRGSKIFCITPIWRADEDEVKNLGTIHDARRVIAEEAQKRDITVIDGYTLVPHRTEYFEDERLHPNEIGFALYAQNLIKALQPYLK